MRRLCVFLALIVGCVEPIDRPASQVDELRVIGVVADPPEAAPGEVVQMQVLLAAPEPGSDLQVGWTFCRTPKALSEGGFASQACIDGADGAPRAAGLALSAPIPDDACQRFGSEAEAGLRPRDPDGTGGYYQPLRIEVEDGPIALARLRIRCPLANAPLRIVQDYAQRYTPNRAPSIDAITLGNSDALDPALTVQAGEPIELEVHVTADSRESFVRYDSASNQLLEQTEHLSVAWFTTDGEFEQARTEVDAEDSTRNLWLVPTHAATAQLWVVLRDDRGGLAAQTLGVRLEP